MYTLTFATYPVIERKKLYRTRAPCTKAGRKGKENEKKLAARRHTKGRLDFSNQRAWRDTYTHTQSRNSNANGILWSRISTRFFSWFAQNFLFFLSKWAGGVACQIESVATKLCESFGNIYC